MTPRAPPLILAFSLVWWYGSPNICTHDDRRKKKGDSPEISITISELLPGLITNPEDEGSRLSKGAARCFLHSGQFAEEKQ
jgi:hypothetical protein